MRRLILNHNPLKSVQNLDTQCDSLEMLDIGFCKISNIKFVCLLSREISTVIVINVMIFKIDLQALYLRRFTKLVSLIIEGNLFRTESVYSERIFIFSTIQSLLVFNSKIITAEEKKEVTETHRLFNVCTIVFFLQ